MINRLLISSLLAIAAASAQTDNEKIALDKKMSAERSGPMGITAVLAGPPAMIPGAPYSAEAVTQRIQLLADGNRISQTTTNRVARDSKGRVYHEESLKGYTNGDADPPHTILLEDPVAGVHYTIDSSAKVAYKTSAVDRKKIDENSFQLMHPNTDDASTTDLGMQTIEGLPAKGTRVTRTIPAGAIGNDLPIVITTETWFSPDLKVLVMSKSSDPRMGETIYKLSSLSRGEPDPALFQVPPGFTIKDRPAGNLLLQIN